MQLACDLDTIVVGFGQLNYIVSHEQKYRPVTLYILAGIESIGYK
jgi:hypothetical protein